MATTNVQTARNRIDTSPPPSAADEAARLRAAILELDGTDRHTIEEGRLGHTDLASKLSPGSIGVD